MLKGSPEPSSAPSAAEHDSPLPARKVLRAQLNACFPHDSDLDAFSLDWFPEIYRQFARGMTRTEKLNLLLGLGQPLEDVAKALATEWALRTQPTVLTPPAATVVSAPRPRRGQQEQEIIIEDDFHALSPDKLAGWMRTIQRLVGQELTVVLRNCRAGSVILTLRGDWRALRTLKNEFAAGRLRTLNGYRVRDVRWLDRPRRRSVLVSLTQSVRVRQLHLYLAVGRLQLGLRRLSARVRIPRWAIVLGLFFLFSGAAWATQKVARAIAHHIGALAPAVHSEQPKPSPKMRGPRRHHGSPRRGPEKSAAASAEDTVAEATPEPGVEPAPESTPESFTESFTESAAESAAAAAPETGAERSAADDSAPARAPASHPELLQPSARARSAPLPVAEAVVEVAAAAHPDADMTLSDAQDAFVNGDFREAISLARTVHLINPTRAWRIIGAAACNLKEAKLASEAFRHLDSASRQYLIYTCQRQGLRNTSGSKFRLSEP